MSRSRRDPRKAKLRRDRIRREKQQARATSERDSAAIPDLPHPFAAERSLREIHALLENRKFGSIDEVNARLEELSRSGRASEMAHAWKRDDPKWRAQELAYDALETDDLGEALRLVNEALELDPDCTDAQRLMVSILPAELDNRIQLMREVVEKAERNLGKEFFEEQAGHFWGSISTRPYMRAMQSLGELLAQSGERGKAIAVFERMLDLNPRDNQGVRYPLLALYLATNRPEDAARLMDCYPDEEKFSGPFAWARVLERWLAGELADAETVLAQAREVNPFVERYISGKRQPPAEAPAYYRPGKESEAQVCAQEFAVAWKSHRGFQEWLRGRR